MEGNIDDAKKSIDLILGSDTTLTISSRILLSSPYIIF